MDNPFQSPAVLSLCTGMRGLERGLDRVIGSHRTVAYVEIEAFVIENLVRQMEAGVLAPAPVFADLKNFPYEKFYRRIHWFMGGYPCQGFSNAGLRRGANDPRHLWPFIARGIKESRPVGVWFENVEGHISLGLRDVLTDLRKLGYQTEVGLFSAAEVGAPHRRNRVFILGLENSYLLGNGRRHIEELISASAQSIPFTRPSELAYTGDRGHSPFTIDELASFKQEKGSKEFSSGSELDNARRFGSGTGGEVRSGGNTTERAGESGLANADGRGQSQLGGRFPEGGQWPVNGSEELGDAAGVDAGRQAGENEQVQPGGSGVADSAGQGLPRGQERSRGQEQQPSAQRGGDGMDNSAGARREAGREFQSGSRQGVQESVSGSETQWPARPGEPQYDWEEPRVSGYTSRLPGSIRSMWRDSRKDFAKVLGKEVFHQTEARLKAHFESGVGYATSGYNFREDLLRMAGNAVVEQQAELAFRYLIKKFI